MSFGDRLGLGGLVVALLSIAAFYLWPDKKWIGWLSLTGTIALIGMWAYLEFQTQAITFYKAYPVKSTLGVFLTGGAISVVIWLFVFSGVPNQEKATQTDAHAEVKSIIEPTPAKPVLPAPKPKSALPTGVKNMEKKASGSVVIGHGAQITQQTVGPNSPNIIGSGNQITINSAPPPRGIPPDSRADLIRFLSEAPAKVQITAIVNDPEAYRFALDWYEVLDAAGWEIVDKRVFVFMAGGQPLVGVELMMRGEPALPNQTIQVPNAEPAAHIANAMSALKVTFSGQRYPGVKEGLIVLSFYARPPEN